ncbi:MAG: ParB N-terminal domain-containing protein [Candidatus Babeliaceae bacterium]|nr:ParB N-terminal domain-containing protein [Candidatus Babeliaceae bacterium]
MKYKIKTLKLSLLKEHEKINEDHVAKLVDQIGRDGYIANPVIADKDTLIILDGHHRFNALKRLGLTTIPVCLCRL